MSNTYNNLPDLFSAIADAIREKTGESGTIVADDFPTEISQIEGGSSSDHIAGGGIVNGDGYFTFEASSRPSKLWLFVNSAVVEDGKAYAFIYPWFGGHVFLKYSSSDNRLDLYDGDEYSYTFAGGTCMVGSDLTDFKFPASSLVSYYGEL